MQVDEPGNGRNRIEPNLGPYARLPLRVNHLQPVPTAADSPVIHNTHGSSRTMVASHPKAALSALQTSNMRDGPSRPIHW